jgi:hypothetical protein
MDLAALEEDMADSTSQRGEKIRTERFGRLHLAGGGAIFNTEPFGSDVKFIVGAFV